MHHFSGIRRNPADTAGIGSISLDTKKPLFSKVFSSFEVVGLAGFEPTKGTRGIVNQPNTAVCVFFKR
jgi:hypothetical protein